MLLHFIRYPLFTHVPVRACTSNEIIVNHAKNKRSFHAFITLESYGVSASMVFLADDRLTDYCGESNVMAYRASPAPVSRLSQPSSDTPDERISRLYHTRSASASPCPPAPPNDGGNNLALASGIS